MRPYQGGGDMISSVTFEKTTYNDLPHKFEAGTPHIAGAIGLGAAVDYMQSVGVERIAAHEADLLAYGTRTAGGNPRPAPDRHGAA
jgi:cysteine desulfurase / selenocysteine lyase